MATMFCQFLPGYVGPYGIKINHRIYDCADLGPFRRQPSGVARKKNLWEIHRDLYDANWIWVRTAVPARPAGRCPDQSRR
ncbi:hypothetical protein OG453_19225 [Streptomyces sp. NBC_01381]|uniref:hypothetical protein n=1 Tax=Streptomyces sp. NBC_01381 TaxID=2903845 RepID=UPI002258A649|nr:hypothetical protein [Streptomyces sp. NBC_01381]MCX4668782.1 hypothetical protein [Streptomyces sp. NBC_01381]